MQNTLQDLSAEMMAGGVPVSPAAVLGLAEREDGVYLLDRHPAGSLPADVAGAIGDGVRVVELAEGESARHLYFIPWDPSVAQAEPEATLCKRMLFERVLAEFLATAGRAMVPGELRVSPPSLLSRATFGLASRWKGRNEVTNVVRAIREFLRQVLIRGGMDQPIPWDQTTDTLTITLKTNEDRERILRMIEDGQPAEWLEQHDLRQQTLFEPEEGG